MKKIFMRATLIIVIIIWWGNLLADSDFTGTVHTIDVNKTWGGIFIQITNLPIFEPGSVCESTWAYMPILDPYTKYFMSVALSSKSTGERIRISTKGCITTSPGQVPIIDWMDYGIRD